MNIELRWVERWPKHMPSTANILPGAEWRKERVLQYRVGIPPTMKYIAENTIEWVDDGWSDWRDVPVVPE